MPKAEKEETPRIELSKNPKGVTVIEGFPGFGVVATITTGFLIEHLKCEQIGKYHFESVPATIAMHNCKLVDPVGVFYNKKYNIVFVHAITSPVGIEWQCADLINNLCKDLEAKELISIEGVGSTEKSAQNRGFYYCSLPADAKKWEKIGVPCLGEGIVIGVTAALLQKYSGHITSLFAETHSKMPDSRAAAKIIEILDKYLGLKVDYTPLLKQAEEFEKKLKSLLEQFMQARKAQEKKPSQVPYIG